MNSIFTTAKTVETGPLTFKHVSDAIDKLTLE